MPRLVWCRKGCCHGEQFDPEVKARAVRMVCDHVDECGSVTGPARPSGRSWASAETLRGWVRRAEVDAGLRDGPTSEELEQLRVLKADVKRLREDNEILRLASYLRLIGVKRRRRRVAEGVRRRLSVDRVGPCWRRRLAGVRGWA